MAKKVERVQTGIRLEKRLLKVLKGLAEYLDMSLGDLLERVLSGRGRGLEIQSCVRGIPKGSRLAVSTNLLASLIAVINLIL